MGLAIQTTWVIGWAIGALVVVIAASLLLIIIALARRIVGQAEEITSAIDGGRRNTTALFDVSTTNHALDRITRGLRTVRTGGDEEPQRERTEPLGEGGGPVGSLRRMWKEGGE